jgi:hypothetical protein
MSEHDHINEDARPDRSIPEPDPMDALIRRERGVRQLPVGATCAICGEINPVLLEVHHIAGAANDQNSVVVLCLNHHRSQSVDQSAAGIDLDSSHQRTIVDRVVAWLRGLGLFFAALALACRDMADWLAALAEGLDANYPAWRELPEADG